MKKKEKVKIVFPFEFLAIYQGKLYLLQKDK